MLVKLDKRLRSCAAEGTLLTEEVTHHSKKKREEKILNQNNLSFFYGY